MSKTGPGNVAAGPVLVPSLGPDIGHCAAYALDHLCPGPQQLLFGALQIILCVYSHLPSFSLAWPVEHILTCLLSQPYKVALSTVTNHQSHFSTLFLQR